MKKFLIILTAFSLFSCNVSSDLPKKDRWVRSYKALAFYHCLCEITDNQFQAIVGSKGDLSFLGEVELLGVQSNKHADSIASKYAREIPLIVPDEQTEGSDFYEKRALVAQCLNFYEGKYLDSIGKVTFRQIKIGGRKYRATQRNR